MRRLLLAIPVLALFLLVPLAEGINSWEVQGTILELVDPFSNSTEPLSGVQVRLSARWADASLCPQVGLGETQPCPWNQANWTQDMTGSSGGFSCQSIVYPDPLGAYDREFRVEVRHPVTSQWILAGATQVRPGPTGMAGLHIPAPVHTVTLDQITVNLYPEPPIDLVPSESNGENPVDPNDDAATQPTIGAADPCRPPHALWLQRPDFQFIPLSTGGGTNTSPDGLIRVQMRQNGAGDSMARRLRFTMVIANQGSMAYSASDPCIAGVRIIRNEGPNFYPTPTASTTVDMVAIPGNNSRMMQVNVTLRGTGNDGPGLDWNEGYEHVVFELILDPDGRIAETNELNNRAGPYCYHAPSNQFMAMGSCVTADSADARNAKKDPGPKEKGPSRKQR